MRALTPVANRSKTPIIRLSDQRQLKCKKFPITVRNTKIRLTMETAFYRENGTILSE